MVNPCKNKLLALHLQSISFGEERIATLAQLVEQRIRNAQVVGSSPIPSSRTNRFVKPFGEQGGFSFSRDLLSECAISAPFQKSALILSL